MDLYLYLYIIYLYKYYLVGGFNPFEKYARQNGFIFPNFRGEHKKIFELPPPSYSMDSYGCFLKWVVPRNHPFLIGFSIINPPFWGIPIFGNTHMDPFQKKKLGHSCTP